MFCGTKNITFVLLWLCASSSFTAHGMSFVEVCKKNKNLAAGLMMVTVITPFVLKRIYYEMQMLPIINQHNALLDKINFEEEPQEEKFFGEELHLVDCNEIVAPNGVDAYKPSDNVVQEIKYLLMHRQILLFNKNYLAALRHQQSLLKNYGEDHLAGLKSGDYIAPRTNASLWREHRYNPISFLNECYTMQCSLTRFFDKSGARDLFEKLVVKELVRQNQYDDDESLSFVSVGSGELFQEFIILTRLFEQCKDIKKTINLVLIDTAYKDYIERRKNKDNWESSGLDYSEDSSRKKHARFTQFFSWFKNEYPQQQLRMFIYCTVNDYLQEVGEKDFLKANIYMGSDLDKNTETSSLEHYLTLLSSGEDKREQVANRKFIQGHNAYLSAPLSLFLKPHGIGLMLLKDDIPRVPRTTKHCVKILEQDAEKPDDKKLLVDSKLSGRYVTLEKSYYRFSSLLW